MATRGVLRTGLRKVVLAGGLSALVLAGSGLLGTPSAVAKAPASGSPAGTYTATLFAPKEASATVALTLSAKGHFSFQAGPKGKWTETGNALTMTATFHKTTFVFTITQKGTDLGSKSHPGRLTADGAPDAKWYAVPTAS
jgi:hypothetical protein